MNPANGKQLGVVPDCDSVDLNLAVDAASNALPKWSGLTAEVFINTFSNLNNAF